MSDKDLKRMLSRRLFLSGGAGVAGATLLGSRISAGTPVAPQAVGRPAAAGTNPVKRAAPGRHRRVGVDAAGRPGRPAVLPRLAGARRSGHLRLRLPRRHRDDRPAGRRAARPRAGQRADAVLRRGGRHLHHADEPGPAGASGPVRRPHPALARLRERDPALRRGPGALARRTGGSRLHLLLPPARRRDLHVPLPLRGRGARADGHDRPGVHPAAAEQDRDRRVPAGHEVRLQRRRRVDALRPRVRVHAHRALVGGALPRRAHPGQRLDRLRPELLAAQRPRLPRHRRAERRPDAPRTRAGCSTSRSPRWSPATSATGCCCGCRTSATRTTR